MGLPQTGIWPTEGIFANPYSKAQFQDYSVRNGGGGQEEEFNHLCNMTTVSIAILSFRGLRFIMANEIAPPDMGDQRQEMSQFQV